MGRNIDHKVKGFVATAAFSVTLLASASNETGFGTALRLAGDCDLDGMMDLAVSAPLAGGDSQGFVAIVSPRTGKILKKYDGIKPRESIGRQLSVVHSSKADDQWGVAFSVESTRNVLVRFITVGSDTVYETVRQADRCVCKLRGLISVPDIDSDQCEDIIVYASDCSVHEGSTRQRVYGISGGTGRIIRAVSVDQKGGALVSTEVLSVVDWRGGGRFMLSLGDSNMLWSASLSAPGRVLQRSSVDEVNPFLPHRDVWHGGRAPAAAAETYIVLSQTLPRVSPNTEVSSRLSLVELAADQSQYSAVRYMDLPLPVSSLGECGDVNKDGKADIVVACQSSFQSTIEVRCARDLSRLSEAKWSPREDYPLIGRRVCRVPDLDRDAIDDYAVSRYVPGQGSPSNVKVLVFSSSSGAMLQDIQAN